MSRLELAKWNYDCLRPVAQSENDKQVLIWNMSKTACDQLGTWHCVCHRLCLVSHEGTTITLKSNGLSSFSPSKSSSIVWPISRQTAENDWKKWNKHATCKFDFGWCSHQFKHKCLAHYLVYLLYPCTLALTHHVPWITLRFHRVNDVQNLCPMCSHTCFMFFTTTTRDLPHFLHFPTLIRSGCRHSHLEGFHQGIYTAARIEATPWRITLKEPNLRKVRPLATG